MRRGNSLAAIFLKGMKFMAEYSNSAIVTVAAGQNVPFTEEANTGKPCIVPVSYTHLTLPTIA